MLLNIWRSRRPFLCCFLTLKTFIKKRKFLTFFILWDLSLYCLFSHVESGLSTVCKQCQLSQIFWNLPLTGIWESETLRLALSPANEHCFPTPPPTPSPPLSREKKDKRCDADKICVAQLKRVKAVFDLYGPSQREVSILEHGRGRLWPFFVWLAEDWMQFHVEAEYILLYRLSQKELASWHSPFLYIYCVRYPASWIQVETNFCVRMITKNF